MKRLSQQEFEKEYLGVFDARPKLYIVAGSYQQAKDWAHKHYYAKEGWKYVLEVRDLQGVSGGEIVFVGTWARNRRKDLIELIQHLVNTERLKYFVK